MWVVYNDGGVPVQRADALQFFGMRTTSQLLNPPRPTPPPPLYSAVARPPSPPLYGAVARPPSPPLYSAVARPPSPPLYSAVARPPSPPLYSAVARPASPPLYSAVARPPSPPLYSAVARPPLPPVQLEENEFVRRRLSTDSVYGLRWSQLTWRSGVP